MNHSNGFIPNSEAELVIIGSMLLQPDCIPDVRNILADGPAFCMPELRTVYSVVSRNHAEGKPIELTLLLPQLTLHPAPTGGWEKTLIDGYESVASSASVRFYAQEVADRHSRRLLMRELERTRERLADPGEDSESALADLRRFLDEQLKKVTRHARFAPVPITELEGDQFVEWIWEGYAARGHATLLAGLPKCGKTTLLAHLLKRSGERVIIVSEESRKLWMRRREELQLGESVLMICRPFLGRPNHAEWERFIAELAHHTAAQRCGLVVLDTVGELWPVDDENDAAKVQGALGPLGAITNTGAGLLLLHHLRKASGGEGIAARGSSAMTGWADVIVELRRYRPEDDADRRRTLKAFSRFDETPSQQVIELGEDGYDFLGTRPQVDARDRLALVLELLPFEAPGITIEDILSQWPTSGIARPGERRLRADLNGECDAGGIAKTGNGRKGDPHRYHSFPALMNTTPPESNGDPEPAA